MTKTHFHLHIRCRSAPIIQAQTKQWQLWFIALSFSQEKMCLCVCGLVHQSEQQKKAVLISILRLYGFCSIIVPVRQPRIKQTNGSIMRNVNEKLNWIMCTQMTMEIQTTIETLRKLDMEPTKIDKYTTAWNSCFCSTIIFWWLSSTYNMLYVESLRVRDLTFVDGVRGLCKRGPGEASASKTMRPRIESSAAAAAAAAEKILSKVSKIIKKKQTTLFIGGKHSSAIFTYWIIPFLPRDTRLHI